MNKLACLTATAFALATLGAALPAAAAERQFDVVNSNGSVSIQRVWTAPAGAPNTPWVPATMTSPVAANGDASFDLGSGASCFYDVKVQFSDGVEQTFANVNVCTGQRVRAT